MRRLSLTVLPTLIAVLAVPAAAPAAKVKISPNAAAVSAAGVIAVEAANPNRYALRGKALLAAGGRTIASRSVRLSKRSVRRIRFRLGAAALEALRAAGGRATMTLKLRRAGGRKTTARRALTLSVPPASPQAPGAPPAPPAPPSGEPAPPPPPAATRWMGRMGTEGEYDDLELTVENGQMTITKPPLVPVSCFEIGGGYNSWISFELFDAPGPWAIGTDGSVQKEGTAVNQLVSSGARTITYKVEGTTQDASRVAGKLGMSFSDSKYDIFTNDIWFINCLGSQSFEAIPA